MPNPLATPVSVFRNRFSTSREPQAPVPENTYEGDNIPYRGIEDHGVDGGKQEPYPDYATGHDEAGRHVPVYEPEPASPEPVPVYVVRQEGSGMELRRWRTQRITVSARTDALQTQIVGRSEQRTTVTFVNTDATRTVWIGPDRDLLASDGFPLGPGKDRTITSEDGFYAQSADGLPIACGVIVEYSVAE